ncbi:MAG TPA: FAD-binding oxidoreductase [Terriglobia bacterium]|nr:FAD-binding oxidoreductase [Terriglobia bacterium]
MASVSAVQTIGLAFAAIVGETRATADPAACAALAVDGKIPAHVVYPAWAEEVAAVLKYCSDHDLAVIPCRNGAQLGIGNPPHRYDVALSLKDMNQVWYYEPADLVISVEPGMKLGDLQRFLARHRLWLPLDPPGGERASIGGILAANAAGPLRLRYGGPRDMVLGMKIATTEGKIIKTGGRVVKNVAGYDLAKLLIGSYGTLGVIVEATFKLYPRPADTAAFVLAAGTLEKARDLRRAIQQSPLRPMRMALLDPGYLQYLRMTNTLTEADEGWQIWLEAGGSAAVLDRYARELEKIAGAAAVSLRRRPWDATTEDVWGRITGYGLHAGSTPQDWLLKASLPVAATEEFIERARQANHPSACQLACWAYAAVGTVYLWLMPSSNATRPSLELVEQMRAAVLELGGSLVVELAPADFKSRIDTWGPPGDDFEVMRKLKAAWDPSGIMAPGRFLGGL